jgi:uncharacterized protein YeaO (DUF488 family)
MSICLKRVYEAPSVNDGYRVLVDRVWPRGITRQRLQVDAWLRDLAPSTALRKWFAHDPDKWQQFKRRYFSELEEHTEAVGHFRDKINDGQVTLVYSARDEQFNNAVALREYLESLTDEHKPGVLIS